METLTYSTVAVTLGLVVARPRLGNRIRITPAMAAFGGVLILTLLGVIRIADIGWALGMMWRPMLGIVAIMVMTGVARRAGVLDGLAESVFVRAGGSAAMVFALVFGFGVLTAAVLNNDSAVLLLTPLVVGAARRRFPRLVVPLAFAVFLSAGVAPIMVANPMNMVVASFAGIGFNEYAFHMIGPALAGAIVTFGMARAVFARDLAEASADPAARGGPDAPTARLDRPQRIVLAGLLAVVLSYPIVSWFGGPVWAVATVGAIVLVAIGARLGERPTTILRSEVHYDVLAFLFGVLLLSIGLRNVGIVTHLQGVYDGASTLRIGAVSALGSAILNNHPMSHLNMMALESAPHRNVLAALIGGDLGPRLFPMGSLAGLLWLEMLRRSGVEVTVRKFLAVGAVATLPTLATCLLLV